MRFASLAVVSLLISTACGGANTAAEVQAPVAVTEVSLDAEPERDQSAERGASEEDEQRRVALEAAREAGVLGVLSSDQGEAVVALFGSSGLGEGELGGLQGATVGEAFGAGGLGLRGVGVGGGGTGETIGLGTVGTIGTRGGSGGGLATGSGYGGLGRTSTPAPKVKLGAPTVQGQLDAHVVYRILRRHVASIRYCYEKELIQAPTIAGEVRVAFTIAPNGAAVGASVASSTLQSAAVESCLLARVRTMTFPEPEKGVVLVEVSIDFAPPPPPPPALPSSPFAPPPAP